MTGLVFLHGWGLGPATWAAWPTLLATALGPGPLVLLDAGYFGPPSPDLPSPDLPGLNLPGLNLPHNPDGWVGVGHSLGFARLAELPISWRGLIGLGAFLHFCPTPAHSSGTPPEVLDAMLARLDQASASGEPLGALDVLARFHRRCGLKDFTTPPPDAGGLARLRADLLALRDLDLAPERIACPTLLLHAADDRIAPLALGREAAERIPGARLAVLDSGGHALPVTQPASCLVPVQEFLRGLA